METIKNDIESTVLSTRLLGIGRTIIALAQFSFLVLTPIEAFLTPVVGVALGDRCSEPVASFSMYCLWDNPRDVTNVIIILLILIASGFYPRWTSLLHFWISYSLGMAIGLPDGGESAAMVITFFYIFASINDGRRWHWERGGRVHSGPLAGVAWAGSWMVRIQVAFIYLWGGLSKLAIESWQDGTAVYYVARMEFFGAAGFFDDTIRYLTAIPLVALAGTWGTIVLEVAISILLLANRRRAGVAALVVCIFIHSLIIVMIGIVSFAMIMIGGVTIAASYSICRYQEASSRDEVFNQGKATNLVLD